MPYVFVSSHMKPCSIVHFVISNMCSRCTVATETIFYWFRFYSRQLPVIFSGFTLTSDSSRRLNTFGATFFRRPSPRSPSTHTHVTHSEFRIDNNESRVCFLCASARSHTRKGGTSREKLFYSIQDAGTYQA